MPETLLSVRDLTRRFGGLAAVDGVSFDVAPGEALGVIGPNGAGKTTMFHCVTGCIKPTSGEVTFNGRTVTGRKPDVVVRSGLARTFQIVRPFPDLPVIANVIVPLVVRGVPDPKSHAVGVLSRVGLAERATVPSNMLSEGDLKRLEMARALATDPKMLLLDEPFAGLSAPEISTLSGVIKTLKQAGTALIIVEHKLRELLPLVERVIVMDLGRVIADGPPEEVMRLPHVIEAYLGKDAPDAGA